MLRCQFGITTRSLVFRFAGRTRISIVVSDLNLPRLAAVVHWNLGRCNGNKHGFPEKDVTLQKSLEFRDSRTLTERGIRSAHNDSNRVNTDTELVSSASSIANKKIV